MPEGINLDAVRVESSVLQILSNRIDRSSLKCALCGELGTDPSLAEQYLLAGHTSRFFCGEEAKAEPRSTDSIHHEKTTRITRVRAGLIYCH